MNLVRRKLILGTSAAVATYAFPTLSVSRLINPLQDNEKNMWQSIQVQLGFTGEIIDKLALPTPVQFYHLGNGARTYQSNIGRFYSIDKLSSFSIAGINPYAYCLGDPVNFKDPSGCLSIQAWIGIGLGVLGLTLSIITLGAGAFAASALITAGSLASSYAVAATALSVTSSTLGVISASTGIASAALSESDPQTSATLGWVSLGFGAGSIATGLGSYAAGRAAYSGYSSIVVKSVGEYPSRNIAGGMALSSTEISGHGFPFNAISKFSGKHSINGLELGRIIAPFQNGSKDITLTICFGGFGSRVSTAQLLANQTGRTVHAARGFHRALTTSTDINTLFHPLTGGARLASNMAGSTLSHMTRSSIQNAASLYRSPVLAAQSLTNPH
ncbi:RHS repeat-associated core domain-containing protein [Shewanella sp. VB17]|uniref:RHS repeat-associated core domain-containing protein n=1 Tax=Shewanella sp. VB17 TaxID=2739432 RepID=UPI001564065D|nr:RHS repeat-associated core domain-containing protein [Shewanella sp. VB17]NRD72745.1 RHS repeat-associated core domain-containing protein [Shewanella sp. VB17]